MKSPNTKFQSTSASALLDLVRGLAAIVVCIGHWRGLYFVDYAMLGAHRLLFAVPYILTGAGHQAVIIFFVLSGYLIGGSVFRSLGKGTWSWRQYLTHRLVRLWLVLVPALLLGALIDAGGIHLHRAPALYAGQVPNHIVANVKQDLNLTTFAGNILFLQGIYVHTFGSNGPLWSLANEFWYYILFPSAVLALRPRSSVLIRVLSAALFTGVSFMVGKAIMLAFPIWLLGAALALLPAPQLALRWRIVIAVVYTPLFFYLAKTHLIGSTLSDYILGSATFVLLWSFLSARSPAGNPLWVRFARSTAGFSYTLYLVHLPLLVFIASVTVGDSRWQPKSVHILTALLILAVAIGYAWLVAFLTEFRTADVRRWVEARVVGTGASRSIAAAS
ncbi:MAG: acyltransferase [Acidobacteriaceae bacterium]